MRVSVCVYKVDCVWCVYATEVYSYMYLHVSIVSVHL